MFINIKKPAIEQMKAKLILLFAIGFLNFRFFKNDFDKKHSFSILNMPNHLCFKDYRLFSDKRAL